MRRLPLDFRDQYFGCEIELTGINRATAAQTLADLFGTRAEHSGGGYDAYRVKDLDGKEWKIVRDSSIHPECRRRSVLIGETYKVELNSPKLEYSEMEKLQEVVRALRRAGGIVNDSCGMHVHVDASKHTPQSLKNVLSIMYSKEDILFAALKVNPARIDSYCQAVDEPILEEIRKLPSGASMDQLKDRWYQGRDGSDYHYHSSRYRACNMHSVFYHGTIEWRLFNSTLHAGEAKANIILAMAISAQGINQKYTQFRKTPIGDNPAFTFRTFLLRLGLIGPEYKNVRMLCNKIWKMQPPTMRTRPPWIFLWARRTPVRPSLSPTAANLLQTRRRRAPICFEPRVSAPASEWNCRILPPTCETEQRHPKTVCPSCR